MKGTGLIIEDDSPKPKQQAPPQKGKNPFSFFAASKPAGASAAGRAPAPYSIFDESTTSPPTAAKTTKATVTASTRPVHPVGGAPPPSLFDDPPILPSVLKPKRGVSTSNATAPVLQPPPFDGDGFDLMKERLAEQEKLKRKAKEQQPTSTGAAGASRSASTTQKTAAKPKGKDNPFSFKNFATRGDEEKDMDDDEDEDGGAGGGDNDEDEEQVRPGENPFSFKAFAKKSGDGKSHQQQARKAAKAPVLPSLSDDDDEEVEGDKGGATASASVGSDLRKQKDKNPYSFAQLVASPPSAKAASLPLPAISESEDEDDDDIGIPSLPVPHTMEAPDLDVPDFSVEAESSEHRGRGKRGGGDDGAEARLTAQVQELKALLLRAEARAEEERKRAAAIERRALKAEKAQARLRKKEEDDTKQLNDVVQAIEHNLMLATARAEKAEAKVQQLEDKVARCSCGRNPGHGQGGDNSEAQQQLRTIHEQSAYLTAQLHKAANDAEAGIKKLVGGVATLRDIATVLQSIDKLSHVSDSSA